MIETLNQIHAGAELSNKYKLVLLNAHLGVREEIK